MERYLNSFIKDDLKRKIVLLTGPRQCGKTTLAKMLSNNYDYLNFDNPEHRLGLIERSWDRSKELVIFDELHKLKNWKSWLKGIYDTEKIPPYIIVTGSAKLDTYRKVGDSLAGRFFQFRIHPPKPSNDGSPYLRTCTSSSRYPLIIETLRDPS